MSEPIREAMEEETERPAFVVDDDQKAEWCVEKIKEARAELERWKTHYEDLFRKVKEQIDSNISFFERALRPYMDQQVANGTAKRTATQMSYPLPSGKLVIKAQEPTYDRDDMILIPWLKEEAPQFVKVAESVDWAGLKKTVVNSGDGVVDQDGQIVPGIRVIPREDIFKVEVK